MAGIVDVVNKYFRPYLFKLMILILFVIFAYAAYYGYHSIYLKRASKFSNVANSGGSSSGNVATVYMFHVDWCPHCKKALPEWNSFVSAYDGKEVNGHVIKCVDVDCTKESSEVTSIIDQYNIESYPTIKLVKDDKVIEFDSKISQNTLEQFVNTMVN